MNKIEQLKRNLMDVIAEYGTDASIKEYEIAFQDAIERVYPDAAWWQVTNYWDIFDAMFFNDLTPKEVADEIIERAKNYKEEEIEEAVEPENMTVVKGKTFEEYMLKYGDLYEKGELWDFSKEDILSGAVEPREEVAYWLIEDRYYEVPKEEIEEAVTKVLEPKYDYAQSFYKKAHVVIDDDGSKVLISYDTPVARIDKEGNVTLLTKRHGHQVLGWRTSPTTLRHVKEFLRQNGKEVGSLRDLEMMYPTKNEALDKKEVVEDDKIVRVKK